MNKSVDKCTPLAVVLGLLGAGGLFAQTVTVPAGCVVRVPGVGGTATAVGDGGIVEMPDPYAGGNFVFGGFTGTVSSWTLLGDISLQTANVQAGPPPGAFPPVQSLVGNVATVNIESYNKTVRLVELGDPVTNARSKGRVTIRWNDGTGCGRIISFDILKKWGNFPIASPPAEGSTQYAPPIVGPNCWGTGLITFSVDQVSSDNGQDAIGYDQYYWTVTNGAGTDLIVTYPSAINNTSDDRSSITLDQNNVNFITWRNAGGPYLIRTCFGRCNAWNLGTALSVPGGATLETCRTKVMELVPTPTFASAIPTCIPTGAGAQPLIDLTNYNSNYTYVWTRSNGGWQFIQTLQGDLTITNILNNDPCTWTLTLTPINPNVGCGVLTFNYTMNRSYTAGLISPGPVCVSTGSNALTINTPANAQGNQTCWGALPSGWTFTPVGISGRTFNIPAASAGGTFSIQVWSCACPTPVTTVTVNVRPATPGPISGPTCVTAGAAAGPYSVPQTGTFVWTDPASWVGTSTTNTINYSNIPVSGTISLTQNGQPGCPSLATTLNVTTRPVVTQPSCINRGAPTNGAVFSTGVAGTVWTFPAGLTASVPPAGPTATINIIGTPGTYACTASVNGCSEPFNVVIPAIPLAYQTTVDEVTFAPNITVISTTLTSGFCYRLWNCSTNSAASNWVSGSSSWSLGATGAGSYTIQVDFNSNGTCGDCYMQDVCKATIHSFMGSEPGNGGADAPTIRSAMDDLKAAVRISPNPNTGTFQVDVMREFENGLLLMYDANGKRVGNTTRLQPGTNMIVQHELAPGVYQVRLEIDGKVEQRSVVITD